MPTVSDLLEVNDLNVRKWGTQLAYLLAPDATVPTSFFGTSDHLPILPAGAKQLGFITTEGVQFGDSISSEKTNMLQSLEPVRSDLTGREQTVQLAFGEDNAFVQALVHGVPFEEFPDDADGPWVFDDGEVSEFPYYRLGIIMQDGVGAQARYRHEFGYRVKVDTKENRTANRSDAESHGVTFGLYKDPATGRTYTRAQNGPSYHTTP